MGPPIDETHVIKVVGDNGRGILRLECVFLHLDKKISRNTTTQSLKHTRRPATIRKITKFEAAYIHD